MMNKNGVKYMNEYHLSFTFCAKLFTFFVCSFCVTYRIMGRLLSKYTFSFFFIISFNIDS